MTKRNEKVGSVIKRIAANCFNKEYFGKVIITVTRVEINNDLRNGKIYVSIFPDEHNKIIFKKIKHILPILKKDIAENLKIKFLPSISIVEDIFEKNRQHIEKVLSEINNVNGLVAKR